MPAALSVVTFAAALILYGAAATLFYLEVARSSAADANKRDPNKLGPRLLAGGALAHASYVVIASFVARVCPVHSVHFILSVASLLATAVYLVARTRFRIHALGLVVAPLGMVVTL